MLSFIPAGTMTFLSGIAMILFALVSLYLGTMEGDAAAQMILEGMGLIGLRRAIKRQTPPLPLEDAIKAAASVQVSGVQELLGEVTAVREMLGRETSPRGLSDVVDTIRQAIDSAEREPLEGAAAYDFKRGLIQGLRTAEGICRAHPEHLRDGHG